MGSGVLGFAGSGSGLHLSRPSLSVPCGCLSPIRASGFIRHSRFGLRHSSVVVSWCLGGKTPFSSVRPIVISPFPLEPGSRRMCPAGKNPVPVSVEVV